MLKISAADTNTNRRRNKGGVKYPGTDDDRFKDALMFPVINPSFKLKPGQKIFTVGSCFARNIERELTNYIVPTKIYKPIEGDPLAQRENRIFNEYNPGTIAQRIGSAMKGGLDEGMGIIEEGGGYRDYYITGAEPSDLDIVQKRRALMNRMYHELPSSDLMVVTLGMVEAWFDHETQTYLNCAPGAEGFRDPKGKGARFELRILNVDEVVELIAPAFERILSGGLKQIMLTVSPVPLQRTFGPVDAVLANTQSKATLRTASSILTDAFDKVDYFPSYEMVTLFAGNPFIEDNVHVKPEIVARVTKYMVDSYEAGADS